MRDYHEKIPVHDRLGGKRIPVHERLERRRSVYDRLGSRLSEQDRLEEIANDLVSDDNLFRGILRCRKNHRRSCHAGVLEDLQGLSKGVFKGSEVKNSWRKNKDVH